MLTDPKQIVAAGYDQLAPYYQHWTDPNPTSPRMYYLARLLELLPSPATILELGCGGGVPVTQALAT